MVNSYIVWMDYLISFSIQHFKWKKNYQMFHLTITVKESSVIYFMKTEHSTVAKEDIIYFCHPKNFFFLICILAEGDVYHNFWREYQGTKELQLTLALSVFIYLSNYVLYLLIYLLHLLVILFLPGNHVTITIKVVFFLLNSTLNLITMFLYICIMIVCTTHLFRCCGQGEEGHFVVGKAPLLARVHHRPGSTAAMAYVHLQK